MKKILISLILALSLMLSSCDVSALPFGNADSTEDTGSQDNVNKPSEDINSSCPGSPDGDGSDKNDSPDAPNDNPTDSDTNTGDGTTDGKPGSSDDGNPGPDGDTENSGNGGTTNPDDNGNGDTPGTDDGDDTTEAPTHKDEDDNGLCDKCGIDVIVEVNFFVINDFHGKMSDSDTQPGADELSLYLKELKNSYPNAILLSSGDMWQGGAESNLTKGLLVTEWLNELDFVSMTLGNHEYDWEALTVRITVLLILCSVHSSRPAIREQSSTALHGGSTIQSLVCRSISEALLR